MALSGTIRSSTVTAVSSDKYPRYLEMAWSATQSIDKNSTTITYSIKAGGTNTSSWCETGNIKVTMNGEVLYQKTDRFKMYSQQRLGGGSITIKHKDDGSLNDVPITIEAGIYTYAVSSTYNGTLDFPKIPRTSTVSCSSVEIGSRPVISIKRATNTFTHTLKYEFYGLTGTIVEKTKLTSYIDWTIPSSFYAKIPNQQFGDGTIYCETYSGTTLIGTSSTKFTTYASRATTSPIIAPTIKDNNSITVALTGDSKTLVKYFSNAQITSGAAAQGGATLVSQKTTCGKHSFETAAGIINAIETNVFDFTATDSRGFTTSKSITVSMVDYVKLTCNLHTHNPHSSTGAMNFTIEGSYFDEVFGVAANNLIVEYRYKIIGGEYSDWIVVTPDVEAHSYVAEVSISGLDYKTRYVFQARATDKLMKVTTREKEVQTTPVFDWSADDFNFNVPVTIQDNPLEDYVVEYGTSSMGSNGTWYWSKWKSGKSECYGCRNFGNMAVTTAWGVLYRSEVFTQSIPYGIFANTPEVIDVTFRNSNFGGWIAKHEQSAPNTTSTGSFILVRPASATLSQAYISFHIVGRWK